MSRLTRGLLMFAVANALFLNAALRFLSPPEYRDTVLRHSWETLTLRARGDSWKPMKLALDYIESGASTPLYSQMLIRENTKFQYPPSALLVWQAIRWASRLLGDDRPLLEILGLLFILMGAVATGAILNRGLPSPMTRTEALVRAGVVLFLTLTFYPVVKAYTLGQIQVWINGLFAVMLWCWMAGHKAAAGALLAVLCLLKPQYALLLPWALLKKEWRLAATCAITGALGLVLSVSQYGWANHFDYLKALSFMARHGEAFYPNQSVNGLMNRLWSIRSPDLYNNLQWRGHYFPPFNPWVYGATLTSSILLLAAAFFHPRARAETPGLCIIALSATLASPIAWEHHYGILLPLYAVLLPALWRKRSPPWKWVVLVASYVLASNFMPALNLLATTPLNVLQSYLFMAALAVLGLFYGLDRETDARTE